MDANCLKINISETEYINFSFIDCGIVQKSNLANIFSIVFNN